MVLALGVTLLRRQEVEFILTALRLVALLLGRLRLSVPKAKEIFARMSEEIFSEQKPKWKDGRFKATKLENSIKNVLRELKIDQEAKLLVEEENKCRM